MIKLTLKLLLLAAVLVTLAVFCGGWKWHGPTNAQALPNVQLVGYVHTDGWTWE